MKLLNVLGCLTLPAGSFGAYCRGSPNPDALPNTKPILSDPPKFSHETNNGKLFWIDTNNNKVAILHVWGTAYEMGFAHGRLLKDRVLGFMGGLLDYLMDEVIHEINGFAPNLPDWFVEDVAERGVNWALDKELNVTAPYTGEWFEEEMRGLSDATGYPLQDIRRIHMLGELTKGSCSMVGAWGEALEAGSGLLQVRTLDWDMSGPFRDFPHITIYHPNEGNAFANVGWHGWVGSITGMSEKMIATSEIGASYADETFGLESRHGIPFTYILRDVLQFDNSLEDAKKRMTESKRTCNLILGVGDGKNEIFNSVRYSASVADFFHDENMEPGEKCTEPKPCDWHPLIKNVVYHGMDWNCPTFTSVLGEQLQKFWGKLTPENMISEVLGKLQSGDVHNAVYDLTKGDMYVAVASPHGVDNEKRAYQQSYYKLDMNKLFSEPKPEL